MNKQVDENPEGNQIEHEPETETAEVHVKAEPISIAEENKEGDAVEEAEEHAVAEKDVAVVEVVDEIVSQIQATTLIESTSPA